MKKRNLAVLFCSVGSIAVAAWSHFATAESPPLAGPFAVEVDPVPATAALATGLNYSTGFEATEGFPLGYISNTPGTNPLGCGGPAFPCWGHTGAANASLITPTIESVHPASGLQHLRLSYDPTTRTNQPNFGLGIDARYPRTADLSVRPVAPNTVSVDLAIDSPGGQNFRLQPQSNSQGGIQGSALFYEDGEIYILDDLCGSTGLGFLPTGFQWDTTGAYRNFTWVQNPCNNTIEYYYGGNHIYSGCTILGTNLEQFLVFGDNFPGSTMDVDNVVLSSEEACPCVCGNGVIEFPCDECESFGADANCPGRCIPPGQPGECTCAPICTAENPCPVVNGTNGPYLTSDGFYTYSGGSPFLSVDNCGSSYDSTMAVTTVANPGTVLAYNDNCNGGQFGADADPSASCYDGMAPFENAYPSCLCLTNPGEPLLLQIDFFGHPPAAGSSTTVNIRKKSVCGGELVGACCDTNGADQGCTDNVVAADCQGADKVWADQGKCAEVTCNCVPDCTGATCGDDGCGGSCGSCNDGNICNGNENCNANRTCDAGTALDCNDGVACNGLETCNPQSGCVAGIATNCDDGIACTVDMCSEPDGSCSHDNSDCPIPTVSQWGLVALTLLLLVAAKVQFGRRRMA